MRKWIAEFQNAQKNLNGKLTQVEEKKQYIQDDFSAQLAKVRDEFAKLSQISVQEQEELEERVAELENELNTAQASMAAGAALDQKKKVDALQADADSKLKKSNA